jgi:hypothetical protein
VTQGAKAPVDRVDREVPVDRVDREVPVDRVDREVPVDRVDREVRRFDERNARGAQDRVDRSLGQVEELLGRLKDKDVSSDVAAAVKRVREEFDALIEQGANASPSEILVVVMISKEPEDKVQESKAKVSDADKAVLEEIEKRLGDARVPFWTALASLGKVKEWSASLEISAGFFAVKGTGGISVTFGG